MFIRSICRLAAIAALFASTGCATIGPASSSTAGTDARECFRNFLESGSVISPSGKTFTSSATVPGVTVKTAMDRAGRQIALEGLTITTLDREAGLITAANRVTGGKAGATVQQTVTFEPSSGGVKLNFKVMTGFGLVSAENAMRESWCKITAAAAGK